MKQNFEERHSEPMQIDSGIPVPPSQKCGGYGARTLAGAVAKKLRVGQSYYTLNHQEADTARQAIKRYGGVAAVRVEYDDKGRKGWRIWRTA